jgi:hypothetical protein
VALVGTETLLRSVLQLLVTVGLVPNTPTLVTLMIVVIDSTETSFLTIALRHNTVSLQKTAFFIPQYVKSFVPFGKMRCS